MGYRKFFAGDTVLVDEDKSPTHGGHTGRVVGILITPNNISYRVGCECGKNTTLAAAQMDLVSTPHDDPDPQTIHEMRMAHFLRRVGVEPQPDSLKQQVKKCMAACRRWRDHTITSQRFGLDGSDGKTLQEIGDAYGITRARVQQIEARVLRTIRRAMEKEKHENRVGASA